MTPGRRWYNQFWQLISRYFPALLTYCRPVSLEAPLQDAGFVEIESSYISQNTFPSEVLRARKDRAA